MPSICSLACAAGQTSNPRRAFRTVPIKFISVSRSSSKGGELFADEWLQKIVRTHNPKATSVQLKPNPKKSASPDVQRATEGERILALVAPQDYLVVLDERGKDITSLGFAELIASVGDERSTGIVFAVGGPYGHSEQVRGRANKTIKLSSCVLNHAVAQVVLLEQVYRAYTILKGEPYHH